MDAKDFAPPKPGRVARPCLLSLNVGTPKTRRTEDGGAWRSAIYKSPVAERLALGETNLTGDRQANLRFHGGPDKAVCCFASEHYPFWRGLLGLDAEGFPFGAFGENFTLAGLTEPGVCVGDTYAVGGARVQVSQPRQPCINLVHKWGLPDMPDRVVEADTTGFYLRVLETGEVGAGDELRLLERPYPDLTITALNGARYGRGGGPELWARLAELPELSEEWRRPFRSRVKPRRTAATGE